MKNSFNNKGGFVNTTKKIDESYIEPVSDDEEKEKNEIDKTLEINHNKKDDNECDKNFGNKAYVYADEIKENNNNSDNIYNNNNKKKKKILKHFDILIDKRNAFNSILSSTFAGIISRTVTAPLDRVKYIMQITNNLPICEIFKIIKKDGIICGFFRGNCVNIVKIIPELSIKMYSYEFMKLNVYKYYYNNKENNIIIKTDEPNMNIPFFIRFLIGSSSGAIAALFIYPLEIVKTRLIVSNKIDSSGIIKCLYDIYKNEPYRHFYNGLSMHIYGVLLFSGCNMSIYDYLKYLFFSFYKEYIHSNYCLSKDRNKQNKNLTKKDIDKKFNELNNNENYEFMNITKMDSIHKNIQTNSKNNYFTNIYNESLKDHFNFYSLKNIKFYETFKKYSSLIWNNNKNDNYSNNNNKYDNYSNKKNDNYSNNNFVYKKENHLNNSTCSYCNYRIKNVNCLTFLLFGITSSFIAQIVSYPFLVLRTRMQTLNNEIATNYLNNERKKFKSCSFILYNIKIYGYKSLYRGVYVNLLKTIPATSITWFAYEYAMRKLQRI
ncbi:transporter, putative [Plasmodium sp. gorilla clade G2]|uniref:transporter, putative n=1 Tax=Plasmodium sp. gorilla clade G2 TaxID=880535 RepID=UPI000D20DF02|nr:transporter, putative [Plasmodium sp. gorilla clade G2]SOV14048.1 transporter, putative [Plasmodium sp. gorilla clade G2]